VYRREGLEGKRFRKRVVQPKEGMCLLEGLPKGKPFKRRCRREPRTAIKGKGDEKTKNDIS